MYRQDNNLGGVKSAWNDPISSQVKSTWLDLKFKSGMPDLTWLDLKITKQLLTWFWLDLELTGFTLFFLPYKLTPFQIYNEVLLKKKEKIPQIMQLINFSLSFGFRLDLTWSNILAFWLDLTWYFIYNQETWLEHFWYGYDLTWLELKKNDLTTPSILGQTSIRYRNGPLSITCKFYQVTHLT